MPTYAVNGDNSNSSFHVELAQKVGKRFEKETNLTVKFITIRDVNGYLSFWVNNEYPYGFENGKIKRNKNFF